MSKRILAPLAVAAALAVPAYAQTAPQDRPAAEPPAAQSGERPSPGPSTSGPSAGAAAMGGLTSESLVGKQARNAQGQELGKIENLVIDPQSGNVTHVVVSVGGFLGIGDKGVAVPWADINLQQDTLVVDVSREELEAAQPFREETAAAPAGGERMPATGGERTPAEPPAAAPPAGSQGGAR